MRIDDVARAEKFFHRLKLPMVRLRLKMIRWLKEDSFDFIRLTIDLPNVRVDDFHLVERRTTSTAFLR